MSRKLYVGNLPYETGEAELQELFARSGNPGCSAHALESAAVIVGQAGQPEAATELLAAADELRRRSGTGHKPFEIRARHGAHVAAGDVRAGHDAALARTAA